VTIIKIYIINFKAGLKFSRLYTWRVTTIVADGEA